MTLVLLYAIVSCSHSATLTDAPADHGHDLDHDRSHVYLDKAASPTAHEIDPMLLFVTLENNVRVLLPSSMRYNLEIRFNEEQLAHLKLARFPILSPRWTQMAKTPYGQHMAATLFVACKLRHLPYQALFVIDEELQMMILPHDADVTIFPEFGHFAVSGLNSELAFYQYDGDRISRFIEPGHDCTTIISSQRFFLPAIYAFWRHQATGAVMLIVYNASGTEYKRAMLSGVTFPDEKAVSVQLEEHVYEADDHLFQFNIQFPASSRLVRFRASALFPFLRA